MGEADGAVVVDVHQAVVFEAFEDAEAEGVQGKREGFGEGEAVEGLAFGGRGAVQGGPDPVADRRGDRHRAAPRPLVRARDGGEQPAVAHRAEQVAQQPQVALAEPAQPVRGERLQRAARAEGEEFLRLPRGQRLQGEPGQQLAGPQPGHRAGHGRGVPGDDQQAGAAVHGELVDQGGGGVVEQVRVVDQQQPHAGQQAHRPVQGDLLGQQVGEGREGDAAGLGRAGRPDAVGAADGLGDQAGLAAPGGSGHHDAGPAGRERAAHQGEFLLPAGERPGQLQRLRILFVSRHVN
ncbi:hypothetical protein GCM10020295_71750 [Streptomyces cinereospinus]